MQVKGKLLKLVASVINVFFLSIGFAFSQEKQVEGQNKDSLIVYHYKQLEAAVKLNPNKNKFYCCAGSIMYIEKESKIYSKSDGTFAGKLYFTKSDFIKWKKWYLSRHTVSKQTNGNL